MGVEAAMGQADLFHDVGDACAVVPGSPGSARGGPDDQFVGDCFAAHMMTIMYRSGAERNRPTWGLIGGRSSHRV